MIKRVDLHKAAKIALNTMTKFCYDEGVSLAILGRICVVLGANPGEIMDFVDTPNMNKN